MPKKCIVDGCENEAKQKSMRHTKKSKIEKARRKTALLLRMGTRDGD